MSLPPAAPKAASVSAPKRRALARSDFLALAAHGRKIVLPAFVLQYRTQPEAFVRLGFTVTKKHGNAVRRNRIRRRLREAVRITLQPMLPPGDYVFIPRAGFDAVSYAELCAQLRRAHSRL